MTGLFDPEREPAVSPAQRPLLTVGISAAGFVGIVTLALKLGLFASIGASSTSDLTKLLNDHNATMIKQAETLEHALLRIARLLEIRCMHDAKTDADRSACLQP